MVDSEIAPGAGVEPFKEYDVLDFKAENLEKLF